MKIDAWLDIACPFCYIGLVNFNKGIKDYSGDTPLEIEYRSFQLERTISNEPSGTLVERLSEKYNQSIEETEKMMAEVTESGREAGIEMHMNKVIPVNTLDAHRLVKYAETKGLAVTALNHLFKAYFTDGVNVSDYDMLIEIAEAIGLDPTSAGEMLNGSEYKMEVISDQNLARDMGIQGVPFLALNMKYAVGGARSPEDYLKALEESAHH